MSKYEDASTAAWHTYRKEIRPKRLLKRLREDPIRPTLLLILHALHFRELVRVERDPLSFLVQALCGVWLADFISGCVHLFFDYYEVDLSLPNQRGLLAYGAWGFQYHHSQNKNWLYTDVFKFALIKQGFTVLYLPQALLHLGLAYAEVLPPWVAGVWFFEEHLLMWTQVIHALAVSYVDLRRAKAECMCEPLTMNAYSTGGKRSTPPSAFFSHGTLFSTLRCIGDTTATTARTSVSLMDGPTRCSMLSL